MTALQAAKRPERLTLWSSLRAFFVLVDKFYNIGNTAL